LTTTPVVAATLLQGLLWPVISTADLASNQPLITGDQAVSSDLRGHQTKQPPSNTLKNRKKKTCGGPAARVGAAHHAFSCLPACL
jgi:hypothetical protein